MKILFISMPSIHFVRWIESLENLDADLYWFDILDRGRIDTKLKIHQFVDWKKRKNNIKGVDFIRKNLPKLHSKVQSFYQVTIAEELERIINEVKPDVIHSFEMQSCSYPIVNVMKKHHDLKWIYSCWGSDLYYYGNISSHKKRIVNALVRIDYLHADNQRDAILAKDLGFNGKFVGVIPGGGGYDIEAYNTHKEPIDKRKVILVKGYEHRFGRAIAVVKALMLLNKELNDYEIVIFGAHKEVYDFVKKKNLPFKVLGTQELNHEALVLLMGKALIYIGNSTSDGLPNTLLEAVVMGAFPIQSNPGNVTAEVVEHGKNGFLIDNPEDFHGIAKLIKIAVEDKELLMKASQYNSDLALKKYNYKDIQHKIINVYQNSLS